MFSTMDRTKRGSFGQANWNERGPETKRIPSSTNLAVLGSLTQIWEWSLKAYLVVTQAVNHKLLYEPLRYLIMTFP